MNKVQLVALIMANTGITAFEAARALDNFNLVVINANDTQDENIPNVNFVEANKHQSFGRNKSDRKRNRANRWR